MGKANPDILKWARESAGLSLEQAAKKLSLKSTNMSGVEVLQAFEAGEKSPTHKQLMIMAKQYHRPFITFFLPAPPRSASMGEDFRRLPDAKREEHEGSVNALVRDIYTRQSLVKDALIDSEEDEAVEFVGMGLKMPEIDEACQAIRDYFGIDITEYRKKPNAHEAFNYLRALVEERGIYVLLIGDLGSHHSSISTDAFRGFALSDPIAPFVVINQNDSKPAWCFTLLHEVVHLWLGKTGISAQTHEHQVERYCNDVASHILITLDEIRLLYSDARRSEEPFATVLQREANYFNISASLVAYRLFRANLIDQGKWQQISDELRELWLNSKATRKKENSGPSGNFYNTQRHRAGGALIGLVRRSLHGGVLTETKAGRVLGVSPGNVAEMVGL
ncbi:ImmA/IrrE family metallo-endopeptidase [Halomonas sp. McH1-25]|uniref:ImmA/IrrE family metallo-endopeptidase n=1 Tax=unclassified Halomonas TaxID=2609666 RepID=UPI001EF4268A|nr:MULTISPECIES: ImmA/IrrE family metallo-endopeptidase [unclassified Halomonas]MCG7598419.1 ImmA/IrrE family metallo-endopeptidase [Halomonas sp. McH1-25]MCP1343755.1 ImmA/IrrE family metallo-endopeptidase [Halomonas sp. FL8]MCP1361734.1 ImmA/IrrE family metallo-endopeptidase [Halomonas sp. BBD45]MCP1363998.1 ImmA/IrrE family metallo-endopeptidase [Halomonas sp. BBD48]